jgi:hypothetical protein
VLHEYASRLALRVDAEEAAAADAGTGPPSVSIKLVNSRGGQAFATAHGRGKTKQIGRQVGRPAVADESHCGA